MNSWFCSLSDSGKPFNDILVTGSLCDIENNHCSNSISVMIKRDSFVFLLSCSVPNLYFNFFIVVNDDSLWGILDTDGRFGYKGYFLFTIRLNEWGFSSVWVSNKDNFMDIIIIFNINVHVFNMNKNLFVILNFSNVVVIFVFMIWN